jgi:hypothetical protein
MKRLSAIATGLLIVACGMLGCAYQPITPAQTGWVTLFDGANLNNFNRVGDANWRLEDGYVQADLGGKDSSFLVTKQSYKDFEVRAEFWVDSTANSGVFIRCSDPNKITAANSYEVNIFDSRPDPSYGTGSIVNVAKVSPMPRAGGQWNTMHITAKGPEMTVVFNGVVTVNAVRDSKFASGPIALQYGTGVVKFRKVDVRPL